MRSQDVRGIVVAFVAAALAGASAYLYVGPYRWLAELQIAMFHGYSVQISFLAALMVCAIPLVIARRVLERQELTAAAEEPARPWLTAASAALSASPRASQAMLIGVGLAGVGTFLAARDLTAGALTELDVAALERGDAPPSRYVDLVGGTLLGDRSAAFRDGSALRYYVPYVAREGAAIAFVEIPEHDSDGVLAGPLRGMLERDGLPGPIRVDFEERAEIADAHWVLRYGRDPGDASVALGMAGLGLVLLAIGSAVVIAGRPRG